ncbi:hypothetical protein ES288_A09G228100v1 [Gossypium darwinii]|uniref:Uncharacterized protein n=1 Tax=Gossypium darwinii TaxID=34276 RepID=A0A5D2FG20_GOSDA|nr:hypothetical protein ES288_A09G228100v1 [Gossypium darwinii]
METYEEVREKAEEALSAQMKLTAMWEIRARQKGWREKVAKSNAQTQGGWVASHCLRDSKLCCSGGAQR